MMQPKNEPLTPQLVAAEEKALIGRWSKTNFLLGLDEKYQRITALSLECQRLWNEATMDTDSMSSMSAFKRVSIPIVRRVCGYMHDQQVAGFDTRLESVNPKFQIVPMGIEFPWHTPLLERFKNIRRQYNLNAEADRTALFAAELGDLLKENSEKAVAQNQTYYFYCIGLVDSVEVGGFKVPHRRTAVIFYEFE
jgi:hypothetical protein